MTAQPLRVGLFGGAFDPPHNAHVRLAECAVGQLQLDVLHVLPTGQSWHKASTGTPARHRLAMAQLAFAGMPGVQVDDREILRSGPSYTVDTLRELQALYPAAAIFLVLGTDQARAFTTWRAWETLLAEATICIAGREGLAGIPAGSDLESRPGARVQTLRTPLMPVSATEIRTRVAAGLGVAHLVPEAIARYIEQHQLYQTT